MSDTNEKTMDGDQNSNSGIHSCDVEITFSTALQAQQAMEVLQVDKEPSNRVTKSFRLGGGGTQQPDENGIGGTATRSTTTMCVRFESKELKMLRVSVSSFYDYLTVVLKCFQEFDSSISTGTVATTTTTTTPV